MMNNVYEKDKTKLTQNLEHRLKLLDIHWHCKTEKEGKLYSHTYKVEFQLATKRTRRRVFY